MCVCVCVCVCLRVKINLPLFSTVVPSSIFMFLYCRPFVVITTLSTGLILLKIMFLHRWEDFS